MKVAICDDTLYDIKNLEHLISKYSQENNSPIEIESFTNSEILLNRVDFDGFDEYDIIFLDIIMQQNGIDVASKLRDSGYSSPIIFTTSSKEYAIDAFKVDANGYLLKPISKNELFECLNKLTNKMKSFKTTISVKTGDLNIQSINISEISYIEYLDRRVCYHMTNKKTFISTSIRTKFLEAIPFDIEKFNFVNCHSSYIVNMNQIKSIDNFSFTMKSEEKIPISKKILKSVRDKYVQYLLGD